MIAPFADDLADSRRFGTGPFLTIATEADRTRRMRALVAEHRWRYPSTSGLTVPPRVYDPAGDRDAEEPPCRPPDTKAATALVKLTDHSTSDLWLAEAAGLFPELDRAREEHLRIRSQVGAEKPSTTSTPASGTCSASARTTGSPISARGWSRGAKHGARPRGTPPAMRAFRSQVGWRVGPPGGGPGLVSGRAAAPSVRNTKC